jgi:hypothetical protein
MAWSSTLLDLDITSFILGQELLSELIRPVNFPSVEMPAYKVDCISRVSSIIMNLLSLVHVMQVIIKASSRQSSW